MKRKTKPDLNTKPIQNFSWHISYTYKRRQYSINVPEHAIEFRTNRIHRDGGKIISITQNITIS